jgi:hypothetical protein
MGWEPTGKSNPTNHMYPGRRRCFYLAVLKSGIRSATPRSVGQGGSSGTTGEQRRADAKFVPGFQIEADFWNSVSARLARSKRSLPTAKIVTVHFRLRGPARPLLTAHEMDGAALARHDLQRQGAWPWPVLAGAEIRPHPQGAARAASGADPCLCSDPRRARCARRRDLVDSLPGRREFQAGERFRRHRDHEHPALGKHRQHSCVPRERRTCRRRFASIS